MTYNEADVAVMDVYIDIPSASITFMALVSEYTICHLHYIYTIITRHTFVTSTLYIPTMIDREFHLGVTPVWPQGGDLALFAGVYVCVLYVSGDICQFHWMTTGQCQWSIVVSGHHWSSCIPSHYYLYVCLGIFVLDQCTVYNPICKLYTHISI